MNGTDNGYHWECYKTYRRVDPYMGAVRNPLGYTYTGLFATMGKARAWVRQVVAQDQQQPRTPIGEEPA
jgi:hypothetical protein